MAKPTADTIAQISKVDFDALGFGDPEDLQVLVDVALGQIYAYTGSKWTSDVFGGGITGHNDPEYLEPLALNAARQLTEYLAFRAQEDTAETLADFDLIQSFSAGGYSETRRDPRQSAQIGIASLVILQSLLWPLMDEYHQDEWIHLVGGPNAPAFAVTEVDWSGRGYYPGYGGLPNQPGPYFFN